MTTPDAEAPLLKVESESDDEFWARMLGDDDPCAPGKDWSDRLVIVSAEDQP